MDDIKEEDVTWLSNKEILVVDNLLPKILCNKSIERFEHYLEGGFGFKRSPLEADADGEIRDGRNVGDVSVSNAVLEDRSFDWILRNGMHDIEINKALTKVLNHYTDHWRFLRSQPLANPEVKYQKTSKGDGYHNWHWEQVYGLNRILAWTAYLNDVDSGGETEFLYQSERIEAKAGRIALFGADYRHTHRGNPPLSGDKYIATGWIESIPHGGRR